MEYISRFLLFFKWYKFLDRAVFCIFDGWNKKWIWLMAFENAWNSLFRESKLIFIEIRAVSSRKILLWKLSYVKFLINPISSKQISADTTNFHVWFTLFIRKNVFQTSLDQIRFQRRKENNKTQIFDLTLQASYFVDNNKILNFLNKIPRKNSLFKKNLFDINPIRTSTFPLLCEKSSNYTLWSLPFANKKFFSR